MGRVSATLPQNPLQGIDLQATVADSVIRKGNGHENLSDPTWSGDGTSPRSGFDPAGERQAESLAKFLAPLAPDAVWSSPFRRAVRTAAPLARRRALPLQTDERLSEWGLAGQLREDSLERLQEAFADPDRCLPGVNRVTWR